MGTAEALSSLPIFSGAGGMTGLAFGTSALSTGALVIVRIATQTKLPKGWTKFKDRTTGKTYYIDPDGNHTDTKPLTRRLAEDNVKPFEILGAFALFLLTNIAFVAVTNLWSGDTKFSHPYRHAF